MTTAKRINKQLLTERLETLCKDFRFRWGQPASRSDGVVDLSIDRAGGDADRPGHLLTVFAGLPPPPEVEGLICTVRPIDGGAPVAEYRTDRRGQVRLRGLGPGEYCLAFAAARAESAKSHPSATMQPSPPQDESKLAVTGPNLFAFATSELSQDAFLAWLLAWADPGTRQANGPLHLAGKALLDRMLELAGVPRPPEYRSVRVRRQWNKIDVLAVVNEAIVLPIEDKTHTGEHSGQLGRYPADVRKLFPPPQYKVAPIFFKTGDQGSYAEVEKAGYTCFLRQHFLPVLRHGQKTLGVRNDIFNDFLDHLQSMEDAVSAFRSLPPNAWTWQCWVGFFTELQRHLAGDGWKWVKPPRAKPFLGLGWHWRDNKFLHLEENKLCFKLGVVGKDKAARVAASREWRGAVLVEARRVGLPLLPARLRGTWRTVASLEDYRQTNEQGLVDVEKTVTFLRKAEEAQDAAVARLAASHQPCAET